METEKDDRANLKVSKQCQSALKKFGVFGETYEDIIWKIINKIKRQKNV